MKGRSTGLGALLVAAGLLRAAAFHPQVRSLRTPWRSLGCRTPGVVPLGREVELEVVIPETSVTPAPPNPRGPTAIFRRQRTAEPQKQNAEWQIAVSVAEPHEFSEIADLRLSVFMPHPNSIQHRFRVRAREKMVERRQKGATCLVARSRQRTVDRDGREVLTPWKIVGCLELSTHEFEKAPLSGGEGSRFYITEVAVAKVARRRGIARTMMEAVEVHAAAEGVESLFLHVDENNDSALRLYLKNGFKLRKECMESYNFAAALGLLSGSFASTHHLLMVKDLTLVSDHVLQPKDDASALTTTA